MSAEFLRLLAQRFFLIAVPFFIIIVSLFLIDRHYLLEKSKFEEQKTVEATLDKFDQSLQLMLSEILILKSSDEIKAYLHNPDAAALNKLIVRFKSFTLATQHYEQVRLLSPEGFEQVRVNWKKEGDAVVVPASQLQDKSSRSYYQAALTLAAGKIYLSSFELNRENGVIEDPANPVIRVITPLYDGTTLKAMLVLNYHGQELLDAMQQRNRHSHGELMLVNRDGYWLYQADQKKRWGFEYGHHHQFQNRYAAAWENMQQTMSGQLDMDQYVVTFETASLQSRNSGYFSYLANNREWKIISLLEKSRVAPAFGEQLQVYFCVLILFVLFLLMIAFFWARSAWDSKKSQRYARKLSRVIEQSQEIVFITDKYGKIEYVNPAFEKLTQYSAEEVIGRDPKFLKSGKHREEKYVRLWKAIVGGKPFQDVFINRKKDGSYYYEEKLITPIVNEKNEIIQYVSTGRDISELKTTKHQRDKFYKLAYQDELTGLANRPQSQETLTHAIMSADRLRKLMAVMFIDLDGFKAINDNFGHEAGDQLLKQVAQRLQSLFRKTDTVCRLGGDEFLVIMEFIDNPESVAGIADHVNEELARPYLIDSKCLTISASIGIALYPSPGVTQQQLIERADQAMYQAKKSGKNRFSLYAA